MELDASLEPTIGPYETYEDGWFGYKAAFEAFITVRDDAETAKLARFSSELQGLEDRLPIDPALPQPEARRDGPHPRRGRRLLLRRGQLRRADRRLQPAQRRAGRRGEGQQARDAEEHAGGEVREGAPSHLEGGPRPRRPAERGLRRLLHPHPDARADARPRPRQHHGRRPEDDGAPRAQGHLRRHRGGEGRHLGPVGAAAARGQGGPRPLVRADDVHDLPRLGLPLDPLRHQRGPREGAGPPAQLPARRRRLQGRRRRHLLGRPGEGEAGASPRSPAS